MSYFESFWYELELLLLLEGLKGSTTCSSTYRELWAPAPTMTKEAPIPAGSFFSPEVGLIKKKIRSIEIFSVNIG